MKPDPEIVLSMWVVYDHPLDFPDAFVVRQWDVMKKGPGRPHTPPLVVAPTLEAARSALPQGLACMGRMPQDDPHIVEVWI